MCGILKEKLSESWPDWLAQIGETTLFYALMLVGPAFETPFPPPPDGGLHPRKEYQSITEELLLGDLQVLCFKV